MKIAIHHTEVSFSDRWVSYCVQKNIPYKLVDCYKDNIIQQLSDCDALMWHFHNASPKDTLFAKQLLYSVAASGKKYFLIIIPCGILMIRWGKNICLKQ